MNLEIDAVKIFMIYNNSGKSTTFNSAWGLSVWIEKNNSATLFDTGGDASILWKNINHSGLEIEKLSHIVISHNHWDHKNGLSLILEKTFNKPIVYVVENDFNEYSDKYPNANIQSVSGTLQIDNDLWTTGQLPASYSGKELYEQYLILTQKDTMVLLTGCSHSGIVDMVKTIKKSFPDKKVELVAGGFHLIRKQKDEIITISNELKALNVDKIAPSHCTGDTAISVFKNNWGDKLVALNIGDILEI